MALSKLYQDLVSDVSPSWGQPARAAVSPGACGQLYFVPVVSKPSPLHTICISKNLCGFLLISVTKEGPCGICNFEGLQAS
jgi:hypothetical protein